MKRKIDGILVVEGHGDEAYLSSFIDAVFVVTNGHSINEKDVKFLKSVSGKTNIIILTDSDDAGDAIRARLNEQINDAVNIKVDPRFCNKNNKHGVAECNKEHILELLNTYFSREKSKSDELTCSVVYELGIIDKETRNKVCDKLELGNCNCKQMIKRMNLKKIQVSDIKEVLR